MINTENNKIIAEFMEITIVNNIVRIPDNLKNTAIEDAEFLQAKEANLPFNTDWNWLMPVVSKCFEYGELDNEHRDQIIASLSGVIDIEDTYQACLEFIQWYNNQNISQWKCTDADLDQWGRQLDELIFEFKEKNRGLAEYEPDEYIQMTINLEQYSPDKIQNYIKAYYRDLNELLQLYGDFSNWIIAECIFEQESGLY
jgi:hypothetical protein